MNTTQKMNDKKLIAFDVSLSTGVIGLPAASAESPPRAVRVIWHVMQSVLPAIPSRVSGARLLPCEGGPTNAIPPTVDAVSAEGANMMQAIAATIAYAIALDDGREAFRN